MVGSARRFQRFFNNAIKEVPPVLRTVKDRRSQRMTAISRLLPGREWAKQQELHFDVEKR